MSGIPGHFGELKHMAGIILRWVSLQVWEMKQVLREINMLIEEAQNKVEETQQTMKQPSEVR